MRRTLFFLCLAVVILSICVPPSLPLLGRALVHDDGPANADIAVVLAGDARGNRVLRGAELVKSGQVPAALVSGPQGLYGNYESDLAIAFAVRNGFPSSMFIPFPNHALATTDEADAILGELRRRNLHSFLLVTSDYHSARARRIYLRRANGMSFRTVTSPDPYFSATGWWKTREGRKMAFTEWSKTVAGWLGL